MSRAALNSTMYAGLAAVLLLGPGLGPQASVGVRAVRWEQHPGAQVPLQLKFQDEAGRPVALRDYFGRVPIVLVLAYFSCGQLCPEVLHGVTEGLQHTGLFAGRDYELLAISIDPRDTPRQAQDEKMHLLAAPVLQQRSPPLGIPSLTARSSLAAQSHFLTTATPAAATLARVVGFQYLYDAEHGQFAHPAGFLVLNPGGQISRYFFGVRYPTTQLRAALMDAASGRIGSVVDQLLLLCYHFDPTQGRYSAAILLGLRIAVVIAVLLAALVGWRLTRSPGQRK